MGKRSKFCRGHETPKGRRKTKMADQENTQKEFQGCCEGMPFADMMRKMTEAKKTGDLFNCAEMMSQMMQMCCGARERKEKSTKETKKNSVPHE
jgi:aspartokinase-like uncharacterized kinase